MRSHFLLPAALVCCALAFQSCDEDNDQIIDLEPNDEQLLVSSNTSGMLVKIQTGDLNELDRVDINLPFADADGLALRGDDAYIVNRTGNALVLLEDVFDNENEDNAVVETTSTSTIINGRGAAAQRGVTQTHIAVAQDASGDNNNQNKIFLFSGERSDLTLEAEVNVSFNVWGLDWNGSTLYAIVDNSDSLAVFEDFDDANSGDLEPNYYVKIEGITRTHGITYGEDDDILILTDIGDANSDTDGAFHFISNWEDTLEDSRGSGTIALTSQRRVSGMASLLGNPVDVAYDDDNNRIYIAERARDGGRLLGFDVPGTSSDNIAPVVNLQVAGASSVVYRD